MAGRASPQDLSSAELEQQLRERRLAAARQRLSRLNGEGRLAEVPGANPPDAAEWSAVVERTTAHYGRRAQRRRRLDQTLFAVELIALLGLVAVAARLWQTNRQLNADLAAAQRARVAQIEAAQARSQQPVSTPDAAAALPGGADPPVSSGGLAPATIEAPPAQPPAGRNMASGPPSGAVVLPGGHQPPLPGQAPQPGEAGLLPAELLPELLAYDPLPTPAPGPELALRIRIPAIGVDHPIVQGDDWEQLKLGVGQHIGSADPGQTGNLVLSAHNDIYGEIFRHLDRLAAGNEVILSTASRDYTYVIEDMRIVNPTDVWVMAPTNEATVTLISCFPYRINTHRIAVFGRLVEPSS